MKFLIFILSLTLAHVGLADSLGVKFDGSKNKFRADIESADKVVVRTCGLVPAEKAVSHTIFEITGAKDVADFLKPFGLFGILEGAAGCECNGDPTFDVYKDGKLVTSLALKHGICVYWPAAWPHEMFPASKTAIDDLFLKIANRGYPVYMHQKNILVDVIAYAHGIKKEQSK